MTATKRTPKQRFCKWCQCEITGTIRTSRYCGQECRRKAALRRHSDHAWSKHQNRVCEICGGAMGPKRSPKSVVCSKGCAAIRHSAVRLDLPRCVAANCSNPIQGRRGAYGGMCASHAWRLKNGKELDTPIQSWASGICGFEACGRKSRNMGLCPSHYKMANQGIPLRTINTKSNGGLGWVPEGTKHAMHAGYIRVKTSDGWQREHTMVMEQALGRPLLPHENVHHKNGDRADNRLDNLELWNRSQPFGQRAIDKLAWAREIIELYGPIEGQLRLL